MRCYVSGEFDGTFLVVADETNEAVLDDEGRALRFIDQHDAWAMVNALHRQDDGEGV